MHSYKLIIFDVDGTLLPDDYILRKDTIQAMHNIQKLGYRVSLATGRYFESVEPYVKALGIADSEKLILGNGTIIHDLKTHQEEILSSVPLDIAQRIMQDSLQTSLDTHIFMPHNQYYIATMAPIPEEGLALHGDRFLGRMQQANELKQAPLKIALSGDKQMRNKLRNQWESNPNLNSIIRCYDSGQDFLEVSEKHTSKGNALTKLLQKSNLSHDDVIAVGNAENDLEMIREAGVGLYIEEPSSVLTNITKYHIPKPENHGIEKFYQMLVSQKLP